MSTIIIDQIFLDEKYSKTVLRREVNCDVVPAAGMEIEDEAWERAKKIKKVNINPIKNQYIVFVDDEFVTKKTAPKIIQKFIALGWKEI